MTCDFGHERHERRLVQVKLEGQRFHDFAGFPPGRQLAFEMEVFDYPRYAVAAPGFCPGRDGFADGLIEQQIWEAWETRLVVELLAGGPDPARGPQVVLDVGAHVGWYAVIAAKLGYRVIAYEADADTAGLTRTNADRAGVGNLVEVRHERVTERTRFGDPMPEITLLKADVEGDELEVVRAASDYISHGLVRNMLLEISPCFRPGYDRLLDDLMTFGGFRAYRVPDKSCPYIEEYSADPLAVIERTRITDPYAYVAGIRQENVLLVREGG